MTLKTKPATAEYRDGYDRIFGRKIETQYVNPPIPINNFDWQATYEGYDEGDPVGHGATGQSAIEDLIEKTEP
jgi:hypothetical protein